MVVLISVPHKSTILHLESVCVSCDDKGPLSYGGKQAREILLNCYRLDREGYFEIEGEFESISRGRVTGVIASSDDGNMELFTYEEFRELSRGLFSIVREVYYKPPKREVFPDYEI